MADFKAGRFNVSSRELGDVMDDSPILDAYMAALSEKIIKKAIAIYYASEVKGYQHPSWTTPPKYVRSFHHRRFGSKWQIWNDDPNGIWVEFGAHSGDNHDVPIMRYRPMGRALDASRDLI